MRTVLLVTAVFLTGFAPAPFPKPQRDRDDPKQLEGTWLIESIEVARRPMSGIGWQGVIHFFVDDRVVIRQGQMSIHSDFPFRTTYDWSFRLSRSGGTRAIDVSHISHIRPGLLHYAGVYKLEGDVLTLSIRPETFGEKRDDSVIVLKRHKP